MLVGLIQSLKGLKRNTWGILKKEFYLQIGIQKFCLSFHLQTQVSYLNLQPASLPYRFWTCQSLQYITIYIYILPVGSVPSWRTLTNIPGDNFSLPFLFSIALLFACINYSFIKMNFCFFFKISHLIILLVQLTL